MTYHLTTKAAAAALAFALAGGASAAEYFVVYGPVPADAQRAALQPWVAAAARLKRGDSLKTFDRRGNLVDAFAVPDSMFANPDREAAKHLPAVVRAVAAQDPEGFQVVRALEIIAHDHMRKDGGPYAVCLVGDPRFEDAADPGSAMRPWSLPNPAMAAGSRETGPLAAGGRSSLLGSPVMCVIPPMGSAAWNEGMRGTMATWVSTMGGRLVLFGTDPASVGPALASPPEPIPGLAVPPGMKAEIAPVPGAPGPGPSPDRPADKAAFFDLAPAGAFDPAAVVRVAVAITWDKQADVDLHASVGPDESHHVFYSHKAARNGQASASLNSDFLQSPGAGAWERIDVANPGAAPGLRFWAKYYSGSGPVAVRCRWAAWDANGNVRVRDGGFTLQAAGDEAAVPGTR